MVALALASAAPAEEEPLAIGERLGPISLEDQHGDTHTIDESVRLVLFSRDMEGGEILKTAVADQGAPDLLRLGAAYVADIHRMPGLVARFIAVPRMRDRPYPILLDRDGRASSRLPDAEGRATVLVLDRLTLTGVHHFDDVGALRRHLGLDPEGEEPAPADPAP